MAVFMLVVARHYITTYNCPHLFIMQAFVLNSLMSLITIFNINSIILLEWRATQDDMVGG